MRDCCEAPALRDKSCQRVGGERQDPMLGGGGMKRDVLAAWKVKDASVKKKIKC